MTVIAPNDANIVYSPYNWLVTGSSAKTICAGAYMKVAFTGATPTTLTAGFDMTNQPGGGGKTRVSFRVDGMAWTDSVALASSLPITIPTTNGWTTHTVEMIFAASSEGANRWLAPQNTAMVFTGLTTDTTVTTRPYRARDLYGLALGDSIAEGVRTLKSGTSPTELGNDARLAWAYPLADLLGAEIGVIGFGGTGISNGGNGNIPKFPDLAPYLWDGQARNITTPKTPDFIVAHIGTNDAPELDASVTADALTLLNNWITAAPDAKIFVLPGWNQTKASAILQACQTCSDPDAVTYVDTTGWWNSADASDGLHPYGYINTMDLSPRLAAVIRDGITPTGGEPNVFRRAADGTAVPVETISAP